MISFGLIRQKNPIVAEAEDIESVLSLDLSQCEISIVRGLELFSHIHVLNLSRNKLTAIGDLSLFTKLQFLDLSFNLITAAGLIESLSGLPVGLSTLNLSGCPCAHDERALQTLQDAYPELGIAIEEGDDLDFANEEEEDGEDDDLTQPVSYEAADNDDQDHDLDGGDSEQKEEGDNEPLQSAAVGPVDADEVLRFIVQRKCRLQAEAGPVDLTADMSDLKKEEEAAVGRRSRSSAFAGRWATRRDEAASSSSALSPLSSAAVAQEDNLQQSGLQQQSSSQSSSSSSEIARRMAELVAANRLEGAAFTATMTNLKQTAAQQLAQLDAWRAEREAMMTMAVNQQQVAIDSDSKNER